MTQIPVEEYFNYHPPLTDEQKAKHELINKTAFEFAKLIEQINDPFCKQAAFSAILQAKMFTNQGITIDSLKSGDYPYQAEMEKNKEGDRR